MAPYALKRRKLDHGNDHGEESKIENVAIGFADDKEYITSDDDGPGTSATGPSLVSKASKIVGPRNDSPDSSLLANEMYRSSKITLQVRALLEEVRPNYASLLGGAEPVLRKMKANIEGFPVKEPLTVEEAEKRFRKDYKIAIPFPGPRPSAHVTNTLAFVKPVSVMVVGSYALKTLTSMEEGFAIDLGVAMPPALFQEKDYRDYRYFYKRAYYIACIAAALQEARDCKFHISFEYQHDNPLLPVVVVKPTQEDRAGHFQTSNLTIRILTMIPDDLFPMSKTWPDKLNIALQNSEDAASASFYNATMRAEGTVTAYLKFLYQGSTLCESFKDSCLLGRIWMRQRGFGKSIAQGGFGPFEWAVICAALLQGRDPQWKAAVTPGFSGYQLFKATLQFLSSKDMAAIPFLFQAGPLTVRKSEVPVFFDGPRGMNLLYKMTPWSYAMLRHEARTTLDMINAGLSDLFESVFITRVDEPLLRFDSLVCLPCHTEQKQVYKHLGFVSPVRRFCDKLYRVLRTAFNNRVHLIHVALPETQGWAVKSRAQTLSSQGCIVIGLLLDADNAVRLVDHGPPAEDREAAIAFRKFWGEKSELRRFKDGSILESLVWAEEQQKNPVLRQIICYVLQRHFGEKVSESLKLVGDSFRQLLPVNDSADGVQPLAPFRYLMTAFEAFQKDLRALEGLPLQIRQVSAAGAVLRYASFRIPAKSSGAELRSPVDVVAQLESSARWPDDLIAIQRTKIAFLLKIGELLEEAIDGIETRLGLENRNYTIFNTSYLDVIYPTGAMFRLRVHHDREQTLLRRGLEDGSPNPRRKDELLKALSAYQRTFVQMPRHTESMQTLCTRFPLLSPTVRLLKRWCDSHLLSTHVSEELVELLVIKTFVQPYPWRAPSSVMTGFLRTLTFLSKWDWRTEPLVVPFNADLSPEELHTVSVRFEAWRKLDPSLNRLAMFAASNLDMEGVTWTEGGPSKVVAARFVSLAQVARKIVKEAGSDLEPSTIFASSTTDYDFVIHLRPIVVANNQRRLENQKQFKNLGVQSSDSFKLAGYKPVQLFHEELVARFGSSIVFFHDAMDGDVIAGLWNPQARFRQWKVNLTYSTAPVFERAGNSGPRIDVNKVAMLNDIARLGGDLIESIAVYR